MSDRAPENQHGSEPGDWSYLYGVVPSHKRARRSSRDSYLDGVSIERVKDPVRVEGIAPGTGSGNQIFVQGSARFPRELFHRLYEVVLAQNEGKNTLHLVPRGGSSGDLDDPDLDREAMGVKGTENEGFIVSVPGGVELRVAGCDNATVKDVDRVVGLIPNGGTLEVVEPEELSVMADAPQDRGSAPPKCIAHGPGRVIGSFDGDFVLIDPEGRSDVEGLRVIDSRVDSRSKDQPMKDSAQLPDTRRVEMPDDQEPERILERDYSGLLPKPRGLREMLGFGSDQRREPTVVVANFPYDVHLSQGAGRAPRGKFLGVPEEELPEVSYRPGEGGEPPRWSILGRPVHEVAEAGASDKAVDATADDDRELRRGEEVPSVAGEVHLTVPYGDLEFFDNTGRNTLQVAAGPVTITQHSGSTSVSGPADVTIVDGVPNDQEKSASFRVDRSRSLRAILHTGELEGTDLNGTAVVKTRMVASAKLEGIAMEGVTLENSGVGELEFTGDAKSVSAKGSELGGRTSVGGFFVGVDIDDRVDGQAAKQVPERAWEEQVAVREGIERTNRDRDLRGEYDLNPDQGPERGLGQDDPNRDKDGPDKDDPDLGGPGFGF